MAREGLFQHLLVLCARDIDRAEPLEMVGGELRVQKDKAAFPQALDEMHEADLRRVRLALKHALAKEGPMKCHAVEPADEPAVAPGFDCMAVAHVE